MRPSSPTDATTLALTALASTLSDERKAQRFLELSGVSPDEMRARAAEPALLAAFLTFLEAHEPDLLAVAQEIGCSPEALVRARRSLEDEQ
jgi:hypothetical protein